MRQILVKRGVVKKIMKDVGVTTPTIIAALKYETHTDKAKRIRQRALQLGGVEVKSIDKKQ